MKPKLNFGWQYDYDNKIIHFYKDISDYTVVNPFSTC